MSLLNSQSKSNTDENNENDKPIKVNTINLQLSDVIRIQAQLNEILNNNMFIIDYIDKHQINLINIDDLTTITLKINEDLSLKDKTITSISLLDRNKNNGYAKQNDLVVNTWINIYFGGDTPVIITGEITNLEEDMIEIKTYPDNDTLYIDFGYKGIPLDLPIETIEIREKPEKVINNEKEQQKLKTQSESGFELNNYDYNTEQARESIESLVDLNNEDKNEKKYTEYNLPSKDIKDTLREFIIRADEIKLGEELAPITQLIDVESSNQRFNINSQTDDLLNELLSNIPNIQRTSLVLNNVHTMIERFKQLRIKFSNIDIHGNVIGPNIKTVSWKPLVTNLLNFKTLLFWIIPIAKNVKKCYNIKTTEDISESPDILSIDQDINIEEMKNIFDKYKSNEISSDQNKYVNLLSELGPYLTPFQQTNPELNGDVINDINILNDINVIIDNLGDFYSSIVKNDIIKTQKFIIQRYNLGINKLDASQITSSKMIAHRVDITQPDMLELKSIMTLPEPVVRFSRINLPNTNILEKSNLNNTFINYWQLLNEKQENIKNINIDINDLKTDFYASDNDSKFVNNVKNYTLIKTDKTDKTEINNEITLTNDEIYKEFLQKMVPKTRILFNLIKKYINGKLSIYDVVGYFEPFLVYIDDLTFMQYKDINNFLIVKIKEYIINFKEHEKDYSIFKTKILNNSYYKIPSYEILSSLLKDSNINKQVFIDSYNINLKFTNSELLWKMKSTDFSNIFDTAISLLNINTMMPENINSIIENIEGEGKTLEDEINANEKGDKNGKKCINIVISKQYKSMEEVALDNDKVTYFDKKYDDTVYSILDDYTKEQNSLEPDQFYEFLIQKLITKHKFGADDAPYVAETLINGLKRVLDGDFAILYDSNEDKLLYFKRINNKWKPDNTIDEKTITSNQSLLCNFQKDCIEVNKKYKTLCETQDLNKKFVTENILKEIVNQFDKKYILSKEKLNELLTNKLNYNLSIIEKINIINNTKIYKYNRHQFNIGVTNEYNETDMIISPYNKLRDLILGQPNSSKKQNDIISFSIRCTREAIVSDNIDNDNNWNHWRYCIKTNVKLLPSFLYKLAICWGEDHNNYIRTMNEIIKESGKISDDGDSWVDEHSGYVIRKIDFDIDEGYEEGYKVKTREVMEKDLGDTVLNGLKEVIKKYTTPETKLMSNIINTLSENMGINIDTQKEFIIKIASDVLLDVLISEKEYKKNEEESAKKGKKLPSYISVYNSTILYLVLGAYLYGIQTSIPSIKTRKTYPGCIRSFTGFPFEGDGDLSSLKYIACIAYKIRSKNIHPWSALMGMKETSIMEKIKAFITNFYIKNIDVVQKCDYKLEYLLNNPNDDIPIEHDVKKWIHFLPPLFNFKLKPITNISEDFKRQCLNDFKSGSSYQREKILVIKSKIIFFSLAIQENIQKIVDKKHLILSNSLNEPFLENACCSENKNKSAINYFMEEDNEIYNYNNIVRELSHIINDINAVTKAPLFFCNINNLKKSQSLPLSKSQYNDETIYRAFIVFCKFNSIIPISSELDAICNGKPEHFLNSDSNNEKIRKLKQEGKKYDNTSLLKLLQYINTKNIININTDKPIITQIQKVRNIIENNEDNKKDTNNQQIIDVVLLKKIKESLDTFDIAIKEDTDEMRELKNYLALKNKEIKIEINTFIKDYCTLSKNNKKNIISFLDKDKQIFQWGKGSEISYKNSISDETTYNSIEFIKKYIHKIINIFPNIILNKVDYQNSIKIPAYWGLSKKHSSDVHVIISDYYKNLKPFYEDTNLLKILNIIQENTKSLLELSLETPYMSDINYNDSKTYSIFDKRTCNMLFENYFLQILIGYKNLSENKLMIVSEYNNDNDHEQNIGNIKNMKNKTANMLCVFINTLINHKNLVDLDYDKIMEIVFKSKEREKDTFTDRLKLLSQEERDMDTILKINKLGEWSKGLQKGLTTYDKDTYDEERDYMENISNIEKSLIKNKNVNSENMEQYLEDYMEEADITADIDRENDDIGWFNGDDAGEDYDGEENDGDDFNL